MKRYLTTSLVIIVGLLIALTANAQHLMYPSIMYDARDYNEFMWGRGGAEGHSGAYIQLNFGVTGYKYMSEISAKARHIASNFEITLMEDSKSCIGVSPPSWGTDQGFSAYLRPLDWMTGEWEFVLSYLEGQENKTETARVMVPRFNFPPIPTGIQIAVVPPNPPQQPKEQEYLVWNRIGDPGTTWSGKRVEYRVRHFNRSLPCIDEDIVIRYDTSNYQLWSGNRIAFLLPSNWNPGDHIRIENRVCDDNPEVGNVYRSDRGCKDFILP